MEQTHYSRIKPIRRCIMWIPSIIAYMALETMQPVHLAKPHELYDQPPTITQDVCRMVLYDRVEEYFRQMGRHTIFDVECQQTA